MGGSESSSMSTPEFISQVQKATKFVGSMSKTQPLHPPQVDPQVKSIKGEVTAAILGDIGCETKIGDIFDVNHAFVVFVFSTGEWARAEIAGFKDGASVYICLVENIQHQHYKTFKCTEKGIGIGKVIDWCCQFQKKGNFDIQKRNCYDFARFVLSDQFSGADKFAEEWKALQLEKVWDILKD